MNDTINIYTKAGRKITVSAAPELADRILAAFKDNAAHSMTVGSIGTGGKFTIPLANIDYIEVK